MIFARNSEPPVVSHYSVSPVPSMASVNNPAGSANMSVVNDVKQSLVFSRLPDIPLPEFDGDIQK